jgi:hypothetical protein
MNFKRKTDRVLFLLVLTFLFSVEVMGQEIFIYRPNLEKNTLDKEKKVTLHGEFFGQALLPSTFPSYNDLSGPEDRWTFGFQNIIHFTKNTRFLAQLVTHDDGRQRTKFDWHFSLRQAILDNLVLIIGHDSNHDSDHQSWLHGKLYFLNRNYIGFGLPFNSGFFHIEPFTWFFHHSNQRGHLDLSGEKIKQEYGLRVGYWNPAGLGIHIQVFAQSEEFFSVGQTWIADIYIRFRILEFLEFSAGSRLWKDIQESRLGNRNSFHQIMWGLVIPF